MSVRPLTALAGPAPTPDFPAEIPGGLPFDVVLENTVVGVSYMLNRRFVWANARMAEIFGYAPGELNGQPVRMLYTSQEDYDEVGRLYTAVARQHFYTHERAMARKNGDLIWCRISGRLTDALPAGAPSVWVVQDLSDKKRIEDQLKRTNARLEQTVERRTLNLRRSNEALRAEVERRREAQMVSAESREKYRALFRHMPLGVLVADAQGEITEINRTLQLYLGASTKAMLDMLLRQDTRVQLPDGCTTSLARLVQQRVQAMQGRTVHRFDVCWLAGTGKLRDIAVVAAPMTNRLGVAFAFTDTTEQRLARERGLAQQAALTHASRLSLMGQMTSALAHELGQPLNACQSYLGGVRHRLADALTDQPELIQALDKAMTHLDQAGQIIRNVRGFVSRHQPVFERTDLPALLDQTLSLLELPLRAGCVRVDVQREDARALCAVQCHPVEIQQVLVNLVMNAIDALQTMPEQSRRIHIRLAPEARGLVSVQVADDGPGVPAEVEARLFDPYITTKPTGLGMGLMICRTIVESHGGSLRLMPNRANISGATFRFTLRTEAHN